MAAIELLDEGDVDNVTLAGLADRAGLAKSNIYRYFESREAILMEVLIADLEDWSDALCRGFGPLSGTDDSEGVARVFARETTARPRLCELLSRMSSVLEQNLTVSTVIEYKKAMLEPTDQVIHHLVAALPSADPADIAWTVHPVVGLITGLWPSCYPAEAVAEALERPELEIFDDDFSATFQRALSLIFQGLVRD